MKVVYERVAGIDISKTDAKVCVRVPGPRRGIYTTTVSTYGSTHGEVLRLRADLITAGVDRVVMEATGVYWKPFFYVLDEEDSLEVILANAHRVKAIPGRKTDVNDAVWLADLAACDLVAASFVPEERIRHLRDLTRLRTAYVRERDQEYGRLEKVLEDACIKLAAVTDLTTKSAQAMVAAMINGERDPQTLAGLALSSMAKKTDRLVEALTGRFTDHHAFMAGVHLRQIGHLDEVIAELDGQIDEVIAPFQCQRELIATIPGFQAVSAAALIGEIGVDMTAFATPGQLAAWAGVVPGMNESAGKKKSSHVRPGNKHLKGILGIAVMSISRSNKTSLAVKYRRIAARQCKLKAIVAIEHTLLTIIWNMLENGVPYEELGVDYYDRRNPQKQINRAIQQLKAHGFDVTLTPAAA